jgi:hypothetical protein
MEMKREKRKLVQTRFPLSAFDDVAILLKVDSPNGFLAGRALDDVHLEDSVRLDGRSRHPHTDK